MDATYFHEKIQCILDKRNITLNEFARLVDVPYRTLTNMRSNNTLPDRTNYIKILSYLGMGNQEFEEATLEEMAEKSSVNMISNRIAKLSQGQQKMVWDYIRLIETYDVSEKI